MRNLYYRLRELVWPAIIAAVAAPASILTALLVPGNPSITVSLAATAITCALLAQRI
jgi:hypothetical protein